MKPAKELFTDTVFIKPRDFDFSQGYPETWDYWEAACCQECGKALAPVRGEQTHDEIDDGGSGCHGYVIGEGPMMNYFYPLPLEPWQLDRFNSARAAKAIVGTNLCLVHLEAENEWGLALTGGGMDFSWEICEAYIRLGYLPPLHFCDLPDMAGMRLYTNTKAILAACNRTVKVASYRTQRTKEHLKQLRAKLKGVRQK